MVGAVEGTLTLSAEDLDRGDADRPERSLMRFSLSMMGFVFLMQGLPRMLRGEGEGFVASGAMGTLVGLLIVLLAQLQTWVKPGKRQLAALGESGRDVTYRFDEKGARISTRASDTVLRYRMLSGYVEGKSAFLLYTEDFRAHVIPKRAFSSQELEQIRSWLRTYSRVRSQANWKNQTIVIGLVMAFVIAVLLAVLVVRGR